jgi:hypothetical protein
MLPPALFDTIIARLLQLLEIGEVAQGSLGE